MQWEGDKYYSRKFKARWKQEKDSQLCFRVRGSQLKHLREREMTWLLSKGLPGRIG